MKPLLARLARAEDGNARQRQHENSAARPVPEHRVAFVPDDASTGVVVHEVDLSGIRTGPLRVIQGLFALLDPLGRRIEERADASQDDGQHYANDQDGSPVHTLDLSAREAVGVSNLLTIVVLLALAVIVGLVVGLVVDRA